MLQLQGLCVIFLNETVEKITTISPIYSQIMGLVKSAILI